MVLVAGALYMGFNKARKSFKEGTELVEKLSRQFDPLIEPASNFLKAGALLSASTAFAQVALVLCTVFKVYSGAAASKELLRIYHGLGASVEAIKTSIAEISQGVSIIVSYENQHKFAKHVHEFVKMRSEEEATAAHPAYFFVYHRGDEWRPAFFVLNGADPLPRLCGIFSDLSVMAEYLKVFRKHVEPCAVFHVLLPVTELFLVPDAIAIPPEIGPLQLEGEIHNQSGTPYVHLNIPDAPASLLRNINNLAKLPQKPGWGRWVASTSAAWAVGLPSAVVATPGGILLGVVGVVAAPVVLPEVVAGAVVLGAGAAAGAAIGTATALFTGKKVEEHWDKD